MKLIKWAKNRIKHKLDHIKISKLLDVLIEHGVSLVIIIVIWEIIEDVLFPVMFVWLGAHFHPAFYAGAPASLLLCLHWLVVPMVWNLWMRLRK